MYIAYLVKYYEINLVDKSGVIEFTTSSSNIHWDIVVSYSSTHGLGTNFCSIKVQLKSFSVIYPGNMVPCIAGHRLIIFKYIY